VKVAPSRRCRPIGTVPTQLVAEAMTQRELRARTAIGLRDG